MNKPDSHRWIEIGRVGRPHGVRGGVRIILFNPDSTVLDVGRKVKLRLLEGGFVEGEVLSIKRSGGVLVVTLSCVPDRSEAERVRGAVLMVREADLPPPAEGEYYHYRLEGLKVIDEGGTSLGKVERVESFPANDVLVVKGSKGTAMVPFVDEFIIKVDLESNTIVIKDDGAFWD